MTYKDIAPVPEEPTDGLEAAYRRLARAFNELLIDHAAIKADLNNAFALQGTSVSTTAPSDNQVLTYDASTGKWTPETP